MGAAAHRPAARHGDRAGARPGAAEAAERDRRRTCARCCADHELGAAPLFVLPETTLDGQGLLPERVIAPLRDWFDQLAGATPTPRAAVVRQTLDGALAALRPGRRGARRRRRRAGRAAAGAGRAGRRRLRRPRGHGRGGHARRPPAARRGARPLAGVRRHRRAAAHAWRPGSAGSATGSSPRSPAGRRPASSCRPRWSPAGHADPRRRGRRGRAGVPRPGRRTRPAPRCSTPALPAARRPDLPTRAERLVRDWQRGVLDLVREEGGDKALRRPGGAYAVNATGLLVMIAVFASTAFIPTGRRSPSAAAPRSPRRRCSRRSSATRRSARWPSRPARTCWRGSTRCSTRRPPGYDAPLAARASTRRRRPRCGDAAAEVERAPGRGAADRRGAPPASRRPAEQQVASATAATSAGSTPSSWSTRVDALRRFLDVVDRHVPDERLVAARDAWSSGPAQRLALSRDHTVVALAGTTGSGKSSLFNALARLELSPVGRAPADHRRRARLRLGPAGRGDRCSTGSACCPGTGSSGRARSTATTRRPARPGPARPARLRLGRARPTGSRSTGCSAWSTWWSGWSTRRSTPTVAARRVPAAVPPARATSRSWCSTRPTGCRPTDVDAGAGRPAAAARRPTAWPGCRCWPPRPSQPGTLTDLRALLEQTVAERQAALRRLAGDLDAVGADWRRWSAGPAPGRRGPARRPAAHRRARRRRRGAGGGRRRPSRPTGTGPARPPAGRWSAGLRRLRPDPLRRLHLRPTAPTPTDAGRRRRRPCRATSLPEPDARRRSRRSALAVRAVADRAGGAAARAVAGAVLAAARSRPDDLPDALDRAVASTDLGLAAHAAVVARGRAAAVAARAGRAGRAGSGWSCGTR